jgi:hypothetical protein
MTNLVKLLGDIVTSDVSRRIEKVLDEAGFQVVPMETPDRCRVCSIRVCETCEHNPSVKGTQVVDEAGFQVVSKRPTDEMVKAGMKEAQRWDDIGYVATDDIWDAMLAAAKEEMDDE